MNWNKLWKRYFPHLSPKEAHAKLKKIFLEGGEE